MPSRYIQNEAGYKPDAAAAFATRFATTDEFESFYGSLDTPERKNQFLRTGSFYRYLVQRGRWVYKYNDEDDETDYLTNSYKVVGLFSLIESLSNEKHVDFYGWIKARIAASTFPITCSSDLDKLHTEYKATYGSIRRCVSFFGRLPLAQQNKLCNAVKVGGEPLRDIKKLAEFLYNLRSKFVHEADLILQVCDQALFSVGHGGVVRTELPITLLQEAFEDGVLAYFRATSEPKTAA